MDKKNIMAGSGLTDTEADKDLLGISEYVAACAKFILNCRTPMSIAVQGGWGTGKSSFMKMVEAEFKKTDEDGIEAVTVWFNTWQYNRSGEVRLFVPLVTCLDKKLDEVNSSNSAYKKYFNEEGRQLFSKKSLLKTLRNAGSTYAGLGGAVAVALGQLLDKDSDGETGEQADTYDEILQLRDKLQERINVMTGRCVIDGNELKKMESVRKRLIVFVDDLDRLAPREAVNLLEDMRNFMDCQDTVFVLALDHNLVNRGVKEKYGDIEEGYENKFFEKIVQLPFFLPTRKYDIRNYVTELVRENNIAGLDPDRCADFIEKYTDRNPRMIKRALNVYQLNEFMRKCGDEMNDHTGLFALILLQMQDEVKFKKLIEVLSRIMAKPATVLMEGTGYEELGKIKGFAPLTCLLKEVFPSFSDLWNELMNSTFAQEVSTSSRDRQIDEVYKLICHYIQENGFALKNQLTKNEGTDWGNSKGSQIRVIRFTNNANINFIKFKNPQQIIDDLMGRKLIGKAVEKDKHFFVNSPQTYIRYDRDLFISNVTMNQEVLQVTAELIRDMIHQNNGEEANA